MLRPVSVLSIVAGCTTGGDSDTDTNTVLDPVCTEPTEVQCVDEMILDLSLHDDLVSDGAVDTTTEDGDFVTTIDATAGGFGNETENPWVYVKFTPNGAERVDLDDESALESMDWDLSARRFILRLNGGSSGPACVGAAAFLESNYADVELADGLSYVQDDYYTSDCTIVNDSSGLPGSPQVALAPWWEYPGCVATTAVPFIIELADGHHIKLVVQQYYASGQETCNDSGTPGQDGGSFTIRWKYLD